jgi:predicted phosphodiesterase
LTKSNKELPVGITQTRTPYILKNVSKVLILNDLHVPYHDAEALNSALRYGKVNSIDAIVLNGDICDFYKISRHQKNPTNPTLQYEIDTTIQVLSYIRKMFPKIKIIYIEGNHEKRLQSYLYDHSELLSLDSFKLENLLKLHSLNIQFIGNKRIVKVGKLCIAHGHEIYVGGVTPARTALIKNMTNVCFGHLHRTDSYSFTTIAGETLQSYSIACLCDLFPDYVSNNSNWNHGFGIVKITDKKGNFVFNNHRIINGTIQ